MTLYDDIYPFYPLQRTSFIFSGRLLTIILVFLLLAVSLLLILPGIRGKLVSMCVCVFATESENIYTFSFNSDSVSFPSVQRLLWMFRIIITLFIGAVVVGKFHLVVAEITDTSFSCSRLFCCLFLSLSLSEALNFTCDWAEAKMTTNATYKSFSNAMVNAEIGLHVGLYGINVTLKGESLLLFLFLSADLKPW